MSTLRPRVVLVTRETELSALLARHGTRGQVEFFLSSRGQSFDEVEDRDRLQNEAIAAAKQMIPADWSLAEVRRDDLNRFLFFPNDIVLALGQDGLVANLAKYLSGQPVIGVTPSADLGEGVLTPHSLRALPKLLVDAGAGQAQTQSRAMVQAQLVGGDSLLALNELFIGHRSHQSARYQLNFDGEVEYQSSSGLIVATGTGLTGWARSIMAATRIEHAFDAQDPKAAFFSREPWPSRQSGASLRSGVISQGHPLEIQSRINDGGVIFADGIEQDFLGFDWGAVVSVQVADARLELVAA
jgi:NAD kinase